MIEVVEAGYYILTLSTMPVCCCRWKCDRDRRHQAIATEEDA